MEVMGPSWPISRAGQQKRRLESSQIVPEAKWLVSRRLPEGESISGQTFGLASRPLGVHLQLAESELSAQGDTLRPAGKLGPLFGPLF